jgi:DNA-directed RNA polymerase specialized sigma24 family protein
MLYLGNREGWVVRRQLTHDNFTIFIKDVEPKLSHALAGSYGVQVGKEATADAIAYAWEHWAEVNEMGNPAGYLYRVGQTAARKYIMFMKPGPLFPAFDRKELPHVEPGLPAALESLSDAQRTVVVLLHSEEWSEREVAELMGVDRSTVRSHRDRGLTKLRNALEVADNE